MAIPKINPIKDSRIDHCYADLNGGRYRKTPPFPVMNEPLSYQFFIDYLLGVPEGNVKRGTVFLIHGYWAMALGKKLRIDLCP